MKRLLSFILLVGISLPLLMAGGSGNWCEDWNGYVDHKNIGMYGSYSLTGGNEEWAAQTYHYDGEGAIAQIRIYGNVPFPWVYQGTNLRIGIYDVDVNNRPTTLRRTLYTTWYAYHNQIGYLNVWVPRGEYINDNFAISVEVADVSQFPFGDVFNLAYTGNGEGGAEDLASLAGTSTGFNWASARTVFNKDGDFRIEPKLINFMGPNFSADKICVDVGETVNFTNLDSVTVQNGMFNKINLPGHSSSYSVFNWDFDDGGTASTPNASHAWTSPGVYEVELTSIVEGWNTVCDYSWTLQVSVGLDVTASNISNVTCAGGHDGSIVATGSGGDGFYEYSLDGIYWMSNPNFNGLDAGNYTLWVQDGMGCTGSTNFQINEPAAILFSSTSSTSAACGMSNGSISATATGGSGSLEYSIDGMTWQSNGSFSGLSGGVYEVQVRDISAPTCSLSEYITVSDQGAPSLALISYTNASCYGATDGSIVLLGSGGSGTLQYSIDGQNFSALGTFSNLGAGIYMCEVKDASGCTDGFSFEITEPPAMSLVVKGAGVSCFGGSDGLVEVLQSTGGTGTHTYSINGSIFQSGLTFSGLLAGSYIITAKDIAGCTVTESVIITEPPAINVSATAVDAGCFGYADGSISVNASGGTGSFVYSINGQDWQPASEFSALDAGTYTIWVMDENRCQATTSATVGEPSQVAASIVTTNSTCGNANGGILAVGAGGSGSGYQYSIDGQNWNSTGLFTNLIDSTYLVLIEDGAGCSNVFTATITDADGPTITGVSFTNVTCNGGNDGTITINSTSGGTGTLEYSADGGPWQLSNMLTGLGAGSHTVVVRDANGCSGDTTLSLSEPAAIVVNTTVVHVDCHGDAAGEVAIAAAGGAGTLAYSLDGITWQSSNSFTGLVAGDYTAWVKDAGGCTNTDDFQVNEPDAIVLNGGSLNVTCYGAEDGQIAGSATGGVGSFTYSLDGITYQSTGLFTGLSGGFYTLYAKDGNDCVEFTFISISEPTPLDLIYNVSDVSCSGGDDGVIDIAPFGGVGPYSYRWSNASSNEDIFNLESGSYDVIVTDANGCQYFDTFYVAEPLLPIIVNAVVNDASGPASTDGSIDLTVTGGTSPYTYSWSNGATTEDLTGMSPGTYTVVITDASGCSTFEFYSIDYTVGMEELVDPAAITLYPNPATNR